MSARVTGADHRYMLQRCLQYLQSRSTQAHAVHLVDGYALHIPRAIERMVFHFSIDLQDESVLWFSQPQSWVMTFKYSLHKGLHATRTWQILRVNQARVGATFSTSDKRGECPASHLREGFPLSASRSQTICMCSR